MVLNIFLKHFLFSTIFGMVDWSINIYGMANDQQPGYNAGYNEGDDDGYNDGE